MILKYIITYYLISTIVMMWFLRSKYEKIVEGFPLFEILSKNMWGYLQFIMGWIIFPICFPMIVYSWWLDYKIKQLEKINNRLKAENDLAEYINEIYDDKVNEMIQNYEKDGEIFCMTFILTREKKIIGFITNSETIEEMAKVVMIVQDHCKQHNTICVINIGQVKGQTLDKEGKIIQEKECAFIMCETKYYFEQIKFDLDHENKKLINPVRIKDGSRLYSNCLQDL